MSLASNLDTISTALDDIKDAIEAKGVTVTGNITTYATAIGNIPTGGGGDEPTIPLGTIELNGTLQKNPSTFSYALPSNITDVDDYILKEAFRESSILSLDLSSLTSVSGQEALSYICYGCINYLSVDLSGLTTVSGTSTFANAFEDSHLVSVDLSGLTTISGDGAFTNTFSNTNLQSITFTSLSSIEAEYIFSECFSGCDGIVISFPALNTNSFGMSVSQFENIVNNTQSATLHFPSNLNGQITSLLADVGGNNTTILYDLPATT